MSPMIDIQRRHADVFRIRLGDKQGNRPRKLTDQIRITARSSEICQAFVDVYGGEVSAWESQYQAYLPTTALNILVLPGQSIQQWWERYRGSVCERRCDGYQEQKSGNRCMCPEDVYERAEDKNACSPMTRLNVLCPDVAVVGAGALVTHSMIAAETLPQSVSVAETALARGLMVPAMLRVVLNDKGRNHFIYPQIEIIGTSMDALTAGEATPALPHATRTPVAELEGKAPAAQPALMTPVPETVRERPAPPVAEQAARVGQPGTGKRRANAAEPIPATGLEPRTAAEADGDPPAAEDLDDLTVGQLKLRCRRLDLPVTGKKDELIARLREHASSGSSTLSEATETGSDAPPPPDDEGGDERRPFDRPGAQKAFHAKLHELGLDYESAVKPWMVAQPKIGASLSKLDDTRLMSLLDAMEERPDEFVASVKDHGESGAASEDAPATDSSAGDHGEGSPAEDTPQPEAPAAEPTAAERAYARSQAATPVGQLQARIRSAWSVLANADPDAYRESWAKVEELLGAHPSGTDWSAADEVKLRREAEDLTKQVAHLEQQGKVR